MTGWELLLYTPGNQPFAALGKLVLAMSASCLLFHPLHVVETRTTAGSVLYTCHPIRMWFGCASDGGGGVRMCGYGVRGVTGGLVRVLKADDALRGAAPTLAHTLLMGQTPPKHIPRAAARTCASRSVLRKDVRFEERAPLQTSPRLAGCLPSLHDGLMRGPPSCIRLPWRPRPARTQSRQPPSEARPAARRAAASPTRCRAHCVAASGCAPHPAACRRAWRAFGVRVAQGARPDPALRWRRRDGGGRVAGGPGP